MADLLSEQLIDLQTAREQYLPGRPCTATVYRWAASGRLQTIRGGLRKRFTSVEACRRFIESCNIAGA
jgi:hypothetical protein